jgi:hypothetical protein
LGGHDLSVGSRNEDSSIQAGFVVGFDNVSAKDLACAYSAVVWSLGSRETVNGPAIRPVGHIEECVFLLKTEPGLMVLVRLHKLGSLVTVVELIWGSIRIPAFSEDQNIGSATKRVGENSNRSKVDIRVVAWGLSSGGTIKVPFWEIIDTVLLTLLGQFCKSL